MLIPSIDLRGGRVVQLVQGRRQALAFDNVEEWIEKFAGHPRVQVIDLDAAAGTGDNRALVASLSRRLPCRVGGGLRTPEAAARALDAGAREVILGSALFEADGVNTAFAEAVAEACGASRVIAAVDALGGRVAVKGWTETLPLSAADAARRLEPWCGGVLYTHIDTEGLMGGIDMAAVRTVRDATSRRVAAAGGIRTWDEIDALEAIGVDAVVGMAVYTGALRLTDDRARAPRQKPEVRRAH
jgi:phosphoribosylformimino-5-aminoimidazole carboxamide ribotide isomerase